MTPIRITAATHEFGPPKGWNPDQHGGCSRLVTRVVDGVWQSAWEPGFWAWAPLPRSSATPV